MRQLRPDTTFFIVQYTDCNTYYCMYISDVLSHNVFAPHSDRRTAMKSFVAFNRRAILTIGGAEMQFASKNINWEKKRKKKKSFFNISFIQNSNKNIYPFVFCKCLFLFWPSFPKLDVRLLIHSKFRGPKLLENRMQRSGNRGILSIQLKKQLITMKNKKNREYTTKQNDINPRGN